jgi:F-type H+-transporting ATPase subunit a
VMGLSDVWIPTAGALLTFLVCLFTGLVFKAKIAGSSNDLAPPEGFGVRFLVENIMEFIRTLSLEQCGEHYYKKYLPLLAGLFVFILVSNLSGLIPGLPPTTESMSTNVGLGVIVFLIYNAAGLKEHGFSYFKQFLGPVAFIAPVFFCIEMVSHLARPLSLGLRLMGNIAGDHILLWVFTGLTWAVVPSFLMFFGLLVSVVQSFVFTLLTSIYISMAVSHDH